MWYIVSIVPHLFYIDTNRQISFSGSNKDNTERHEKTCKERVRYFSVKSFNSISVEIGKHAQKFKWIDVSWHNTRILKEDFGEGSMLKDFMARVESGKVAKSD